jgi:DNA damage-inducible protein 1
VCDTPTTVFRNTCIQGKELAILSQCKFHSFDLLPPSVAPTDKLTCSFLCRPRITISIAAAGEQNDQELLTLDLPPGLTVGDLKGMVEAEAKFPANTQSFFFNGQALRNDTQTLEDAGIKDGEMLAMMVNRRNGPPVRPSPNPTSIPEEPTSSAAIERIRNEIVSNPQTLSRLIQQQPDLAAVINEPVQFRNLWQQMLDDRDRMQRERENQLTMLNEDPFNPEAQKKIEDMIRREKIEANLQYAYENNPEGM